MNELLHLFNLDADDNIDESLRLALMFKEEFDQATQAYGEMIDLSLDPRRQNPREMQQVVDEAINAALLTGLRAYRTWLVRQGVDVEAIEAASGKDIPPHIFQAKAHWPL